MPATAADYLGKVSQALELALNETEPAARRELNAMAQVWLSLAQAQLAGDRRDACEHAEPSSPRPKRIRQ
jgi:hypothetical protein